MLTKSKLLLGIIFLIACFLRFYQLDKIPNGYRQDETSIGYNAYSILKTGRDEHGVFMPQNFKAFGEYKLPGYIYSTVVPISIFGLNPFSIRFISALSGFLTVVVSFFLAKELMQFLKKDTGARTFHFVPHIVALLLAINPWLINFSRSAYEVTLANLFLLVAVYLFLKAADSKRVMTYSGSLLFFALTIYTYNIARLFVPIFIIALVFIFRDKFKSFPKKNIYIMSATAGLLALPYIYGSLTQGGVDSTLGTLIYTSAKIQAPLIEFRSYFVEGFPILAKLLFNSYALTLWVYINNIFAHFSTSFYFIKGDIISTGSIGDVGQWYIFELPLVIAGLIYLIRSGSKAYLMIVSWIVFLILVSSITREPPQLTRTFFALFPVTFLSSYGLYWFVNRLNSLRNRKVVWTIGLLSTLVASYYILYFLLSYFVRMPTYYARYWKSADFELSQFISENSGNYDKIIIDRDAGVIYSTILVNNHYPPDKFISEAVWHPEDSEGFTYPESFSNIELRKIDWENDKALKNTIIITSPENQHKGPQILKTLYYPQRPVVINDGQGILSYPYTDPAYVILSTSGN